MIEGIFIGIILALVAVVSGVYTALKIGKNVERFVEQKRSVFQKKGAVIEPENEQLAGWLEEIKDEN